MKKILINKCENMIYARPCGAMDNASAYGAEDSRFESWQGRVFIIFLKFETLEYWLIRTHCIFYQILS